MENRVRFIAQKRTTLKAQLTRMQNLLDENQVPTANVKVRMERVTELFKAYEELHDELTVMDANHPHINEFASIQDTYFVIAARVEEILNPPRRNDIGRNETVNVCPRKLKLPNAELPKFNGQYDKWLGFKNTFQSMIGNITGLDDVSKFLYLQASLTGDAANKISLFDPSVENYRKAWNLLEKSYEVKRLIITKHLAGIVELTAVKEMRHDAIVRLVDAAQQHVSALESLGVHLSNEMLVYLMEQKLPRELAEKWEETLEPEASPKFERLCDFLNATAIRISKRNNSDSGDHELTSRGQPASKRAKGESKKQAFMIHTSNNCPVCKNVQHPLYRCRQFQSFAVPKRIDVVRAANLCINCMRYHTKPCQYGTCKHCNQSHNSMLHMDGPQQYQQRAEVGAAEPVPAENSQ